MSWHFLIFAPTIDELAFLDFFTLSKIVFFFLFINLYNLQMYSNEDHSQTLNLLYDIRTFCSQELFDPIILYFFFFFFFFGNPLHPPAMEVTSESTHTTSNSGSSSIGTAASNGLISISTAVQLPFKLSVADYPSWCTQFRALLTGYDLMGFIDGTSVCPPLTVSAEIERCQIQPQQPRLARITSCLMQFLHPYLKPKFLSLPLAIRHMLPGQSS